jgi:hypothetical protein
MKVMECLEVASIFAWLESPEGECWSRRTHIPVWRPLISVVRDGDPSDVSLGGWEMAYGTGYGPGNRS